MDAEAAQAIEWQNIIMAFCFTSAIDIATMFVETKSSQLSPAYCALSFAILLTFLFLFVAKLIAQNFTSASQVLEKVAIVVAATAVVLSTTIPLSAKLKCACWALYAASLLAIVVCNFTDEVVKLKRFFSAASTVFCSLKKYVYFNQS